MGLITLAHHTFDESLMPEDPVVLDAGCMGFDFSIAVRERWPEAYIIGIDPNQDCKGHPSLDVFEMCALMPETALYAYHTFPDWQANRVERIGSDIPKLVAAGVPLEAIMQWHCISYFDLIKLDIEGSEFGLLEQCQVPIPARQISVEFHDYREPQTDVYWQNLFNRLGVSVVKHNAFKSAGGLTGHWDSLLVYANTK